MEEQRARQEKDAREAVTASVAESTNLSTGGQDYGPAYDSGIIVGIPTR